MLVCVTEVQGNTKSGGGESHWGGFNFWVPHPFTVLVKGTGFSYHELEQQLNRQDPWERRYPLPVSAAAFLPALRPCTAHLARPCRLHPPADSPPQQRPG